MDGHPQGREPGEEEKKSNEMPTVAASEEGRAQTCKLRLMGVED